MIQVNMVVDVHNKAYIVINGQEGTTKGTPCVVGEYAMKLCRTLIECGFAVKIDMKHLGADDDE